MQVKTKATAAAVGIAGGALIFTMADTMDTSVTRVHAEMRRVVLVAETPGGILSGGRYKAGAEAGAFELNSDVREFRREVTVPEGTKLSIEVKRNEKRATRGIGCEIVYVGGAVGVIDSDYSTTADVTAKCEGVA